jgi:DNA (cytosine-5)-methyltransferase 1
VTDSFGARNATSGRKEGSQHHSGTTLTDAMWLLEEQRLLPTPNAQLAHGSQTHRSGSRTDELLLDGIAAADRWGDYAAAVARHEQAAGRPAPPPTEPGKNGQPRLSPAFVEWMMMLPSGHVTGVPGVTRNQQLKILGNGVVPAQAEYAYRLLLAIP